MLCSVAGLATNCNTKLALEKAAMQAKVPFSLRMHGHRLQLVQHGIVITRTRLPGLCAARSVVKDATTWSTLDEAARIFQSAPSTMKADASSEVLEAMNGLKSSKMVPKWGKAAESLERRNIQMPELKMIGVKDPAQIAKPSVRNDAVFLITVVGSTSVVAVGGLFLPGDWGFFVPYLTAGISIAVLAIGSTAPGLLSVIIDKFSQVFPDYRERVLVHEAAHFLIAYLLSVPVVGYGVSLGREHTDLAEAKLQARLFQSRLTDSDVNVLAVVAMAGVAAEAMRLQEVLGQTADLSDLQRILNRSERKLSDAQQQALTRWAVWQACCLLRAHRNEHDALIAAMATGASLATCVQAIEAA